MSNRNGYTSTSCRDNTEKHVKERNQEEEKNCQSQEEEIIQGDQKGLIEKEKHQMKREGCSLCEKIQQFQEESPTTIKNEERAKKLGRIRKQADVKF